MSRGLRSGFFFLRFLLCTRVNIYPAGITTGLDTLLPIVAEDLMKIKRNGKPFFFLVMNRAKANEIIGPQL